ncbi:hypothetical protein HELRODRAFT_180061 [Helobdella robusta]|uniref:Uncharacterized protein n=1 Tax=Helobdella robusta TaxID=6412 RepID=T1FFF3_HELRO|nr:hypothetical protein HELRODRAFT_180061 [Helobdella robusta]ESN94733.1 hypothetical protein HELRODRAFT_180061 [Helobdella robusta]
MFRSLLLIAVLAVFALAVLSDYILVSAESDDHATQGISKRACPPFFVDFGKGLCLPLVPETCLEDLKQQSINVKVEVKERIDKIHQKFSKKMDKKTDELN